MKILSSAQLKSVDQETIRIEGISSWELMERASSIVTASILEDYIDSIKELPIVVVCGKGNNGGDGLAIARQLQESGYDVEVRLLKSESYSDDNLLNQEKLEEITFFGLDDDLDLPTEGFLVDCLFGYGLSAPLESEWQAVISQINAFHGKVLSVDMPSGLLLDGVGLESDPIVKAWKVYTFQVPKLSLLLPDNSRYVNEFSILDIGLDLRAMADQNSQYNFIDSELLEVLIRHRSRFSHKGTYGHVALIGGSLGKIGAVLLASRAALRTGCGLVTAYIPKCGYQILQIGLAEAMVTLDSAEEHLMDFNIEPIYSSYAVGIGMGKSEETIRGFGLWLQGLNEESKVVLDADALNILSENENMLKFLPKNSVLTPHPKELKRLIGEWENDLDKLEKSKTFARENNIVMVIKGANTAIVNPTGDIYFNSTGNPGMATGGTGDVLTGIIGSLLAQGYESLDAAVFGVYVHGLAGDFAKGWVGEASLIATDVIEYIPSALMELTQEH